MEFNPLSPEFREDPYPAYAELREHAPAFRNESFNATIVTRYDDVAYVLKNPALFSSSAISMNIRGKPTRTIINTDPPLHTRMRNLVNRAFTPRMVADMEPRIRQITRELLGAAVGSGEMELIGDLAAPLPVTVIAEILGVDPALRTDFKRWSNAVVNGDMAAVAGGDRAQIDRDIQEFQSFFERAIEERRRQPKDDLISAVLRVDPDDEAPLAPDEVLAFTGLLLIAGNETTTNLMGNAMLALFEHPDQLGAVAAEPARIPNMVEEALRYDSPVQFLFRTATRDVDIAGTTVPAGSTVIPVYASANRDDRKFPGADRFDIARNTQGHLAFGMGVHFCLGAPLARLEARVMFEELFARTVGFRRIDAPLARVNSLFLRGLTSLPFAFEPAPAPARA